MKPDALDRALARPAGWIGAYLLLAATRIVAAVVLDNVVHVSKTDLDVYDALARNLLAGNGLVLEPGGAPILWRPPAYPLFLAAVWGVAGGESLTALLFAQGFVDAATAVLVLYLGRRLFGTVAGALAALIYIAYPLSVYYTLRVMSEPLFTLTLTLAVVALERAVRDLDWGWCTLVGGCLALNALVRPAGMYLAVLCSLWLVFVHRARIARALPRAALVLVGFAVVVSPWTWRNYQVTGEALPVATGGGYGLWVGNRWESRGREDDQLEGDVLAAYERERAGIVADAAAAIGKPPYGSGLSIGEDKAFGRHALVAMRAEPVRTLELFARKFFYQWFDLYLIDNRFAQRQLFVLQGALLILAGWGLALAWRARITVAPLLLVIGYFIALHTLVVSTVRYSVPLVPLLALLAALPIQWTLNRVLHPASRPPEVS